MNRRPSFLEHLRNPVTGRIIPLKSNVPSPSGGGGAMVISTSFAEVEGPTVLSSIPEVIYGDWSPARPGGPEFSPSRSPEEERTPAERVRPKESPPLVRQYCLEGAALRKAMGFLEGEGLEDPPLIQRRLVFPKGLQKFPGISSTHALFQAPSMDVDDLGTEEHDWKATNVDGVKRQRLCTEAAPPTTAAASPLVLMGHPANAAALVAEWARFTPIMGSPF